MRNISKTTLVTCTTNLKSSDRPIFWNLRNFETEGYTPEKHVINSREHDPGCIINLFPVQSYRGLKWDQNFWDWLYMSVVLNVEVLPVCPSVQGWWQSWRRNRPIPIGRRVLPSGCGDCRCAEGTTGSECCTVCREGRTVALRRSCTPLAGPQWKTSRFSCRCGYIHWKVKLIVIYFRDLFRGQWKTNRGCSGWSGKNYPNSFQLKKRRFPQFFPTVCWFFP